MMFQFYGTWFNLFQPSKGDVHGAEDYYHRATLADPEDGEILSQYAKIVWELHQDKDRALSYFERAVRASPQDRSVLIYTWMDTLNQGFSWTSYQSPLRYLLFNWLGFIVEKNVVNNTQSYMVY